MEESCLTGTVNTTVKRRVKRRPSVIHQARKIVNSQEKSLHKSMLSRSRLGSCTNHKRKIQALLANNKALAQALEVSKCELRQRDEVILELCRQNSLTVPTLIKGKLQEVCNHLHSMVKILQEALTLCDRPEDSTVLLTCSDETNKSLKVDQSQSVTSTITPVHVQAKNKKSFLGQNKSTKFEKPAENLLKKHKSDTSQDTPSLLKVSQFKSNNQAPASEMTPIIEQSFLVEEEALPFLIEDKDTTSVLISDDIISHVHINNKRRYSSRIEGKQKSLEFVEEIHTGSGDGDSLDLLSEGGLAEETLESCRQFHPSVLLERLSHDPITGSNLGDILPNTIKSKRAIEEQEFNNNIDLSVTPKLPKLHSKIPVVKSSKTESDKKLNSAQNRRDTFTVPILQQSKRKEIFPVNSFEENSRRGTFVVQRLKEDSKSKTDTKPIEKVSLSPSQQESDTILSSRTFSVVEPNQDILKPELQGNQSDNCKEIETCLSGCSVGVVDVGTCGPKEPSVKSSSEDKRLLLSPLVSQRHNDKSKPVHHPCSQEEDATCVLPEDMELTCTLDTLVASQSRSLITTDPVDGTHHPQGSSVEQNHRSQAKLAEKVEQPGEKSITSVATLDHEQTFSEDNDDDPEYVPSPNKHNRRKNKQKTGGNLHGKNRKEKNIPNFRFFSNKGGYISSNSKTKKVDNQAGGKSVEPTQTDKLHFSVYDLSLNESNAQPNAVPPDTEQDKIRSVVEKKNAEDEFLVDNAKCLVKKRKNQGSGVPQKKPYLDLEECLAHGNLTKTNDSVVENSKSKRPECKKKQRKICIDKATSKKNHHSEGISQAKDEKTLADNIQNSPKDSQVLFSVVKLEDIFSSSPQEEKNDLFKENMEKCKENTSDLRSVMCKQKSDKKKTKKPSVRHTKLSKPQNLIEMPHAEQEGLLSPETNSVSTDKLKPSFDDPVVALNVLTLKKDAEDDRDDKENKETVFTDIQDTEVAVEEIKQSGDQGCPRQRRAASRVSYKELPLNKKLRQGDVFTVNVYSDGSPDLSGKGSRGIKKKDKKKNR